MKRAFSNGGGVQSTASLILSARGVIDFSVHIFANVGAKAENPETIAYVEQVLKPYAAKHGIEWVEVDKRDRSGNPIDLHDHIMRPLKSIDIPVRMGGTGAPGNRKCTEEWKIIPVSKYLKEQGITILGKGISTDEIHRARTNSGFDHYSVEYPLIEQGLNRNDCARLIEAEGLPMAPKSSCWFCPFQRVTQWQDRKKNQPELFQKSVELEQVLSDRRVALGKDRVYLTAKGARTGATLHQAISDQLDLFDQDLDFCESGFCMT